MAAASSFCRTAHARSLSAFSPRKVDGTRAKDLWYSPAGFPQGPVYKCGPGLFTRLRQIGVWGSAGGSMGPQDVSGRAVSKDSQRLRHWTPDEPVDILLIKIDRRLPSCSPSCLFHEADRRLTQPSLTQQVATPTSRFFLAFPGLALLERLRGYVIGPSLESTADLHQSAADTSRRPTLSEHWAGNGSEGERKKKKKTASRHTTTL